MKNLELANYNVTEMDFVEMINVDGGEVDFPIPHWLAAIIGGAIVVVTILLVIL